MSFIFEPESQTFAQAFNTAYNASNQMAMQNNRQLMEYTLAALTNPAVGNRLGDQGRMGLQNRLLNAIGQQGAFGEDQGYYGDSRQEDNRPMLDQTEPRSALLTDKTLAEAPIEQKPAEVKEKNRNTAKYVDEKTGREYNYDPDKYEVTTIFGDTGSSKRLVKRSEDMGDGVMSSEFDDQLKQEKLPEGIAPFEQSVSQQPVDRNEQALAIWRSKYPSVRDEQMTPELTQAALREMFSEKTTNANKEFKQMLAAETTTPAVTQAQPIAAPNAPKVAVQAVSDMNEKRDTPSLKAAIPIAQRELQSNTRRVVSESRKAGNLPAAEVIANKSRELMQWVNEPGISQSEKYSRIFQANLQLNNESQNYGYKYDSKMFDLMAVQAMQPRTGGVGKPADYESWAIVDNKSNTTIGQIPMQKGVDPNKTIADTVKADPNGDLAKSIMRKLGVSDVKDVTAERIAGNFKVAKSATTGTGDIFENEWNKLGNLDRDSPQTRNALMEKYPNVFIVGYGRETRVRKDDRLIDMTPEEKESVMSLMGKDGKEISLAKAIDIVLNPGTENLATLKKNRFSTEAPMGSFSGARDLSNRSIKVAPAASENNTPSMIRRWVEQK